MSESSLIAVDIGNSSTKIGWGFGAPGVGTLPTPQETESFVTGQPVPDTLRKILPKQGCRWKIASVHREGTRLLQSWLEANRPRDEICVLTHRDLPLIVHVEFPDRVGMDRLAAAVAANALRHAGNPAIVIDAGSAITVDLISSNGAFEGGVILPGFHMSAQALFGADLLPLALLEPNDEPPVVVGKSTEGAIRSGLFWGAVGAAREIIRRMSETLSQPPQIFVTGGDLRKLAAQIGNESIFVPNMVLSGIAVSSARG